MSTQISEQLLLSGVFILLIIVQFTLISYLKEKGKNLASKEDLSELTNIVEGIKNNHQALMEEVKTNNQLKVYSVERAMTLKKEVFLDVVDALTSSTRFIMKLTDISLPLEEITSVLDNNASVINRANVVANGKMINAIHDFTLDINAFIFSMNMERHTLTKLREDVLKYEEQIAKAKSTLDSLLSTLEKLYIGPKEQQDENRWKSINELINTYKDLGNSLETKMAESKDDLSKRNVAFYFKCSKAYFAATAKLPSIFLSIRNELNLDTDEEQFKKIWQDSLSKSQSIVEEFLAPHLSPE